MCQEVLEKVGAVGRIGVEWASKGEELVRAMADVEEMCLDSD